MVTRAEWARFMRDGTEPDIPEYILDAWRLYRRSGIALRSERLPRLSPDDFQERTSKVRWFLERLDEMVTRTKLTFEGFVHFFDKDCYQLYSRVLNQRELEDLSSRLIGCRLSEDLVGNSVNNLAMRLKKPVSLRSYEHAEPIMHAYTGYAEPVVLDGVTVGSLGVYIKEASKTEEALLLTQTITRMLVESSQVGGRNPRHHAKATGGFRSKHSFAHVTYRSAMMSDLIKRAQLISASDDPVLIEGESGTGKEYFAHAIHNAGPRRNGPFVPINCASLSHSLTESELFGYAEGAFTGAARGGHPGKIELADGGTLFLDEVGDLPHGAQAMLLRTLQDYEVSRLGDDKLIPVNIRIICATNKDLRQLCTEKAFRWDLYYRLAGIVLSLPPLRSRVDDIALLAERILGETNQERGMGKRFNPTTIELLCQYSWPGNIREMRNIVRTAHLVSQGNEIDQATIADLLRIQDFVDETSEVKQSVRDSKEEKFLQVLERSGGNVAAAAEQSGISRATGYRWLKKAEPDKQRGR